ncbi:nucleotidyltransferase family protein [Paenibacillus sp. GCM10023250]|uniref:nucleotidyltransferase domain-containing protein n=1 Tax=Paenibacillus sp. GCM10023250 TaxID=3252648 RepID=UPI00361551CA
MNEFTINLQSFPKELQLLLAVLGFEKDNDSLGNVYFETFTDINWDRFLALAIHHRVYPQVYAILKHNQSQFPFPANVMSNLHLEYRRNAFAMFQLSAEMHHVSELLQNKQIRTMVLKGPILAEILYGDLSLRTSKDLDILVDAGDVETAVGLLEEEGYICTDLEQLNISQRLTHHISLLHPVKKIEVELHWRLNSHSSAEPAFDDLWIRSRVLGRSSIHYLSHEDLFFFLVSHGARHGWFRLRWLTDIQLFMKLDVDWQQKMIPSLKHYNALVVGGLAVLLTNQLLKTDLPEAMMPFAHHRRTQRLAVRSTVFFKDMVSFTALPKKLVLHYKWYLFTLHSDNKKFSYLLDQFIPTRRDVEMLRLPKSLSIFYFPLRPLLWLVRRFKMNDVDKARH